MNYSLIALTFITLILGGTNSTAMAFDENGNTISLDSNGNAINSPTNNVIETKDIVIEKTEKADEVISSPVTLEENVTETNIQAISTIETTEKANKNPSSGLPQFDLSTAPSQIFWLFAFFGLMYIFFARKTLPDISSTIENRHLHVQTEMDSAEKFTNEAREAQNNYEKNISDAKIKSQEIIMDMDKKMKILSEEKHLDFKNKLDKEVEKTTEIISTQIDGIISEIPSISSEIASSLTKKVADIDIDSDKIKKEQSNTKQKKVKAA